MDDLNAAVSDLIAAIKIVESHVADVQTSVLAQARNSLAETIVGELLQGTLVLEISGSLVVDLAADNSGALALARQLVAGLGVLFEELADSRIRQAKSGSNTANAGPHAVDCLPGLEDQAHEGGRDLVVGTTLLDRRLQLESALWHGSSVEGGVLDERLPEKVVRLWIDDGLEAGVGLGVGTAWHASGSGGNESGDFNNCNRPDGGCLIHLEPAAEEDTCE